MFYAYGSPVVSPMSDSVARLISITRINFLSASLCIFFDVCAF